MRTCGCFPTAKELQEAIEDGQQEPGDGDALWRHCGGYSNGFYNLLHLVNGDQRRQGLCEGQFWRLQ